MGEYAKYQGNSIKIGTYESMYYLRADQRYDVEAVRGSVDPVKDALEIRFRFPFPDEDHLSPGNFDDYDRGFMVEGFTTPGVDHRLIQFSAKDNATYLVSLPCPLSGDVLEGVKIHRNGGREGVLIRQQKLQANGELWTVVACSACGALWRNDRDGAEQLTALIRSQAERVVTGSRGERGYVYSDDQRAELHTIADRVLAGYLVTCGAES